jgi:hypothetical protein
VLFFCEKITELHESNYFSKKCLDNRLAPGYIMEQNAGSGVFELERIIHPLTNFLTKG